MGNPKNNETKRIEIVARIMKENMLPVFNFISGFGENRGNSQKDIDKVVEKIEKVSDQKRIAGLVKSVKEVNMGSDEQTVSEKPNFVEIVESNEAEAVEKAGKQVKEEQVIEEQRE